MFCQEITAWRKAACSSSPFSPLLLLFFFFLIFSGNHHSHSLGKEGEPSDLQGEPLLPASSCKRIAAGTEQHCLSLRPDPTSRLMVVSCFWDRLEQLVCNPIEFWPEHSPGDSLLNHFTLTAGNNLWTAGTPAELSTQRWIEAFAALAKVRDTCSCLPAPTWR